MFEDFQIDTVSIDAPVSFGGGGEGTEGLGHTIGAAIGSVVGGASAVFSEARQGLKSVVSSETPLAELSAARSKTPSPNPQSR